MSVELLAKAAETTVALARGETVQIPVATKADLADLVRDGLVEVGPQERPGSNKFQFRATASGVKAFNDNVGNGQGQEQSSAADTAFKIDDDIEPPTKSGRTGPKAKYPFDLLNVGQSFFVPANEKKPEPWKSLQSTISTAQRRHAVVEGTKVNKEGETVPNYKPTRKFRMEKRTENGKDGARIWRIA